MDNHHLRRIMYKNARFEVETRIERTRRFKTDNQRENRDRQHLLRRNVVIEPSPREPVVKETRLEKLLKWKAHKKALLLAEKATKKPPFKVGAFQCSTILDVTKIPPPTSAIKSTVKTITKDRPPVSRKPTEASKALTALSVTADTRRITRSQAKLMDQAPQVRSRQPAMSKQASKTGSKPSGLQKPKSQASFAPANHIFKPPINLTFPVTPDLMKRNKRYSFKAAGQAKEMSDWPIVPGVKPLTAYDSLADVSSNVDANISNQVAESVPSAEGRVKVTPKKRRSARLATPKSDLGVAEDNGTNKPPVKENPVEAGKTDDQCAENKEYAEDEENGVVARKISRMSIHSPTQKVIVTPTSQSVEVVPAQFSPFIVSGRGAERHKYRRSRGNDLEVFNAEEGERAEQVKRFRSLLDTETKRLLDLCDKWEGIKDGSTEEIPSEAQDLILGAVGQARLLTKDKFQQFKRLVDKFEEGTSEEEKMTADDLTGFWEMVQITANGLEDRFKKLDDLRSNSWKERVKIVRKNPTAVIAPPIKKIDDSEAVKESRARIREMIAAGRKMRQERKDRSQKENQKTFDGGFFKVESPKRNTEIDARQNGSGTPKPIRKSLLQQVLTNSAYRVVKSPSVTDIAKRIRVSMIGRRVSLSRSEEEQVPASPVLTTTAVPAKSILKSGKSAKKHTVVFSQADSKEDSEKENAARSAPRRSLRFSMGTRFDDSNN